MIYTVTFNPAIDYVVRMSSDLEPGMTNRSDSEECYFGGKGINVSTILKILDLRTLPSALWQALQEPPLKRA